VKKKSVHYIETCRGTVCGVESMEIEFTYSKRHTTCRNCQRILKIGPYRRKIVHLDRPSFNSTLCGRARPRTGWGLTTDRKKVTCKTCKKIMRMAWGWKG
jgi:hypothetical protein